MEPELQERHRNYSRKWRENNKEYLRNYYQENKEHIKAKQRRRHYMTKYGLTPEEVDEMIEEQNGACSICAQPCDIQPRLAVDHCHTCGTVRGLLCQRCNTGIGMFRDDPDLLLRAIEYLEDPDEPGA